MRQLFIAIVCGTVLLPLQQAIAADPTPLTANALSEATGEAPAGANDIAAVSAETTGDALTIRITFSGTPAKGHRWGTMILFDTDLNRQTGYRAPPLGVDYLAQVDGDFQPTLLIHKRAADHDDDSFQGWEAKREIANAVTYAATDSGATLDVSIPWSALGMNAGQHGPLRFRVCESSEELKRGRGEWSPDLVDGYFGVGEDPRSFATLPNVVTNGDFEALNTALATQTPTAWAFYLPQGGAVAQTVSVDESHHAIRMSANGIQATGMNGTPFAGRRGVVTFRYKIDASSVRGQNVGLQVIGLQPDSGAEGYRFNYTPAAANADGKWHSAAFEFRLPSGLTSALIAARVNEQTPATGSADWTIDDVQVFLITEGVSISIANLWTTAPRLRVGETSNVSAFIENDGGLPIEGFGAHLDLDGPAHVPAATLPIARLGPGGFTKVTWPVVADDAGVIKLHATLVASATVQNDTEDGTRQADYRLLALPKGETIDRAEINTDAEGFWQRLPRPKTLQEGNAQPLVAIEHKSSKEIGRNTFGICTQIPRERDYEDPFAAAHLIDGDPETCWSSLQRSSSLPGDPPTVTIVLPKAATLKQINLIPYWKNTDIPRGFTVQGSAGNNPLTTLLAVQSYEVNRAGETRGDKFVQPFAIKNASPVDRVVITFDRLPQANGNYAEVSVGWKARLSGIELIDASGANVALASHGATADASDTFTGWQNHASNIATYYKKIFDLGLKWVRIGQWGDQTEWSAVERTKGEYAMDPRTDAAIQELADNKVDILFGLNYGNALYAAENENPDRKPAIDVGPIFHEGSPFYLNNGPRTPAVRKAFVGYVDYVVRRYQKQVKYWELWNEENGWYPGNEPDLYGELLADVGKKIKDVAPQAKFSFGGTAAPAPITTEIALRHGGAPFVDITAFHPYGIEKPEGGMGTNEAYQGKPLGQSKLETGWNTVEDIIAGVRKPFAEHGNANVDVWMNEFGTNVTGRDYTYNPGIGEFASTKWLLRLYVIGGFNNSPVAWWALHTDNRSQDWGILDPKDFSYRPMSLALRNLCSTLSDVTPIKEPVATLKTDATEFKCISFKRDGGGETVTAVWTSGSIDGQVRASIGSFTQSCESKPGDVTITDLYWGTRQNAAWTWESGKLTVSGLIVPDYPVVISVK